MIVLLALAALVFVFAVVPFFQGRQEQAIRNRLAREAREADKPLPRFTRKQ